MAKKKKTASRRGKATSAREKKASSKKPSGSPRTPAPDFAWEDVLAAQQRANQAVADAVSRTQEDIEKAIADVHATMQRALESTARKGE